MIKLQKKNIVLMPAVFLAVFLLSGCSNSSSTSLVQEEKCATQAKKVFDDNWSTCSGGICDYNYKNHYNSKTGKCYILVSGMGSGGQNYQLSDAFENGTNIALCSSYTAVPRLDSCDYPNSKKEKFDVDKFNNFVKSYMEE